MLVHTLETPAQLPPAARSMAPWLASLCRDFERCLPSLFPPTELGGLAAEIAGRLGPIREVRESIGCKLDEGPGSGERGAVRSELCP